MQLDPAKRYYMLNKPRGVVSSMRDEQGRPDLTRFTEDLEERVFNVGRLDAETSGLLLLTNDGDLAHVLAHPSFGVEKTYIAKVRGRVTPQVVQQLQARRRARGRPDRGRQGPRSCSSRRDDRHSMVELTLHSGRNRIVRRMLDAVGHPVVELVRRSFGPLNLGTLRSGAMRELTKVELGQLLTISRAADAARGGGSGSNEGDS